MSRVDQYQVTQQPEISQENEYSIDAIPKHPKSSPDHHSSTTWNAEHICSSLAQCCCCLCLMGTCATCCDCDDCDLCDC
jgi:hypothetical protein